MMADQNQMRTYRANDCVVFKKTKERFGGLSNMAPGFPLEVNGVRIPTSEALYQACRFPNKPDIQRLIISQRSPMTAKMKSKPYRTQTRSDWEKVRVPIMRWCLRVKLAQNWNKFGDLLLSTEDLAIVEESRRHAFWGAKPIDRDTLVGMNILGRLLMELRNELRANGDRLMRVEPPDISQFLLFGNPIGMVEPPGQVSGQDGELFGITVSGIGIKASHGSTYEQTPVDKLIPSVRESRKQDTALSGIAIPKECKRLAEVDFPIALVSKHSAREKSIRHGHPSTLHLWWARRPLAACRAMLLALLLPDPVDPYCPEQFKIEARKLLAPLPVALEPDDDGLRRALLKFIGDFSDWDLSNNSLYVETARSLIKAAHGDEVPLVVDPFAGGGSIPLEALRLGCDAFASDLNPVACLILKVMLEDIPRHEPKLAEELRKVGAEIKEKAEKELAEFYPKDPDRTTPIAYLWARTVRCESPNCGAEIPIFRSPWLCKKGATRARYFKEDNDGSCVAILIEESPLGGPISLRIARGYGSEDVRPGYILPKTTKATGNNANVICPCCGTILSGAKKNPRVRIQLCDQRGGSRVIFDERGKRKGGAYLLAVATTKPGEKKRHYRIADQRDYLLLWKAQNHIKNVNSNKAGSGFSEIPHETFHNVRPSPNARGLSAVTRYGIHRFRDLYNERQIIALVVFCRLIREWDINNNKTGDLNTVIKLLSLCLSRVADYCSAESRWDSTQERNVNSFGRQALPMLWDYAELVPIAQCVGSWDSMLNGIIRVVERTATITKIGNVDCADATEHPLPTECSDLWFTDPPYYDSVPYADLADFFYVWLKRLLPEELLLKNRFESGLDLTPKLRECAWNRAYFVNDKEKDPEFFERCVERAFHEGRRVIHSESIGCVVFAHKTTEGWEALLSGLIRSGWIIVSSWPIATEQRQRLIARESAALATSVHLVCRPRLDNVSMGDWHTLRQELPKRVGDWMDRLQSEGIRGADLVFACIGPALEIYSRYSKVVDSEDREIPLGGDPMATEPHKRGYLAYVWEVVGRAALEQVLGSTEAKARNSTAGALEEDARLTALFLWTLQATNGNGEGKREKAKGKSEEIDDGEGIEVDEDETIPKGKAKGFSLIFDVVRRFAQPLGIRLPDWEGRIIETKKGVVRLFTVKERAKQLFGETGARVAADQFEESTVKNLQLKLFPVEEERSELPIRGRGGKRSKSVEVSDEDLRSRKEATTLDRVHAAMLLQAGGRANALRALLKGEVERGPDFLRLANALSALYPRGCEEKRLLDAMLLAVPR